MWDFRIRFLTSPWQKISSNVCCHGVVSKNALRQKGTYQDGATSDLRLIDRHQCSWTLGASHPRSDSMRSDSQNSAFQAPIEVPDITFTLSSALCSAKKR